MVNGHSYWRGGNGWTEEKVNLLKELWVTDISARAIGDEVRMSKNSVIGKANRLGLPPKRPSTVGRPRRKRRATPFRPKAIGKPPKPEPQPVRRPEPTAGGISLLDLQEHHCRAIVGVGADNLARYCGAEKTEGPVIYRGNYVYGVDGQVVMARRSYCAGHCQIYYNRT